MKREDEFARCFEWEDDDQREPSGWAAVAGACLALAVAASLYFWHRRARLAGLLLLAALLPLLTWGCSASKAGKRPGYHPRKNTPSWAQTEARNEQAR
jgi:hypothetical protein